MHFGIDPGNPVRPVHDEVFSDRLCTRISGYYRLFEFLVGAHFLVPTGSVDTVDGYAPLAVTPDSDTGMRGRSITSDLLVKLK